MNIWRLLTACVVIACAPTLIACAGASNQASMEVSCDDFMASKNITKDVEVAVDGSLTVTLCSNRTTGYQWSESAEVGDAAVAKQVSHEFIAPGDGTLGAPGKEVWTFKALKKGTTTVSMEYSRPWEGGEKREWTFTLNVVVK